MSYTSFPFLLFVAAVALVYFLFPNKKYQWTVLLAANYIFYLYAGYRYAAFILLTTLTTYLSALWLETLTDKAKDILAQNKASWDREQKKAFKSKLKSQKQGIVTLVLVINFGILVFLKYYNFFAGSLNDVFHGVGLSFSAPTLKLFLPLGISFYTFQSMGYVVDVYREKVKAQRNPFKIALFISFFPQIIQGPISLYSDLAHQLYAPHSFDFTRCKHACQLMLWGFFKKLVIADRAVMLINVVLDDYFAYNGTTLTFTILIYALQLYADFSGGIDISRGVSELLGIYLAENFQRPYFARTISEYWRRWHISLGVWMRDYVFYPIAMSKLFLNASKAMKKSRFGSTKAGIHIAKVLPTSFASLIVFFLVGIWHGANWKYVGFGIWNGGIIMLSTLLEPLFESWTTALKINTQSFLFRLFQISRTFLIVLVGYVFDVAPDFGSAMTTFRQILLDQNLSIGFTQIMNLKLDFYDFGLLGVCTLFLFFVSLIQEKHADTTIRKMLDEQSFLIRFLVLLVGIMVVLVFGIYGPGYNAADFVYMQF